MRFVEALLAFVLRTMRTLLFVQGIALSTALLATPLIGGEGVFPWVATLWRAAVQVGLTLFGTGALMTIAERTVPLSASRGEEPATFRPALFALGVLFLAALSYLRSEPLVALWGEIAEHLRRAGFWAEIERGGTGSGLVMLPIMVALLIPILETATAIFLVVLPPLTIVLVILRSTMLARLFAMLVACQLGLVAAGLLASGAFSSVSSEALAAMRESGDAGTLEVGNALTRADSVLAGTAWAFVLPAVGYLVWGAFLVRRQR
jgi:hypothetical protein